MRQFICAAFLLLGICFSSFSQTTDAYLITSNSVGPVRLGMTLEQARQALSPLKIRKAYIKDMDYQYIEVVDQKEILMQLEALYPRFNEKTKIWAIEVKNPKFKTKEGIHAGMLISDLEKILLKTYNIEMSRELVSSDSGDYYLDINQSDNTMRLSYKNGEDLPPIYYRLGDKLERIRIFN
jgi:hypothetical protein